MKRHSIILGGIAFDGSAGLVTVPFIADPVIRAASNVIQLTDDWHLLAGFAGGAGTTRLRLNSASSRIRGFPNLFPFMVSHLAGDNPAQFDFRDDPIKLMSGENITLQATNGVAVPFYVLLHIVRPDVNLNVNTKGLRWVRFTATLTSVVDSWGPEANIVLDDDLESGDYNVYDFCYFEADAIAGRLVFKDQVERPGSIAQQTVTQRPTPSLMNGMGLLGTFNTITPPFIQSIHVAAAAQSLVGYLLIGRR
jgi:hypothetical protein